MGFESLGVSGGNSRIGRADPISRIVSPWLPYLEAFAMDVERHANVATANPANVGYAGSILQQPRKRTGPESGCGYFKGKHSAVISFQRVGFHQGRFA